MTKLEVFELVKDIVSGEVGAEVTPDMVQEIIDRMDKEIQAVKKKAGYKSKKEVAKKAEDEKLKDLILDTVCETGMTSAELIAIMGVNISISKFTALIKPLVECGLIKKEYVKRTPVFTQA